MSSVAPGFVVDKVNKPLKEYQAELGIKGFIKGYTCRDYKFTFGKTHSITNREKIKLCENGFHSVDLVSDIEEFYSLFIHHHVFALVKQWGTIDTDGTKKCSKHIKIVKYISSRKLKQIRLLEHKLLKMMDKSEVKPIVHYILENLV